MAHRRSFKAGTLYRPKKRLGQHFLRDQRIIGKIISMAGFEPGDLVLEVGPGLGALTLPLSRHVAHIVGIEKDSYLADSLKEKLQRKVIRNVTVIKDDILEWNFNLLKAWKPTKIQVVGNLPYNISSPFLEKLIEHRDLVAKAILMFQSEVAERITAAPGGKTYGAMTLWVQYHVAPVWLLSVPKEAFYPRPKVDSAVVKLDFEGSEQHRPVDEGQFRKVVKAAFSHRRKTLLNTLKGFYPHWSRDVILDALGRCGIDPVRRAETLDMKEFLCLAWALRLTKAKDGVKRNGF